MTKVTITKRQAEFIESFNGDVQKGMYYIARCGWGFCPTDGDGKTDDRGDWTFENIEKAKMMQALLNGYIVEPEKPKEFVMYMTFSDDSHNTKKVYYGIFQNVSQKDRATLYKENSSEITKLEAKGWTKEVY